MKENDIEKRFRDECKKYNCKAIKFADLSEDGAPDRLVLTPWGLCFFVEFKAPGKQPRLNQIRYMLELNRMGFLALAADNVETPLDVIMMLECNMHRTDLYKSFCNAQIRHLERRYPNTPTGAYSQTREPEKLV